MAAFLPTGPQRLCPLALLQEQDNVRSAPAQPLVTEKTWLPGERVQRQGEQRLLKAKSPWAAVSPPPLWGPSPRPERLCPSHSLDAC